MTFRIKQSFKMLAIAGLISGLAACGGGGSDGTLVTKDLPSVTVAAATQATAKQYAALLANKTASLPAGAIFTEVGAPTVTTGTTFTFTAIPAGAPANAISGFKLNTAQGTFSGYIAAGSTILCGKGTWNGVTYPNATNTADASTIPVIAHAIEWQNMHGAQATQVCCIYATAPFVQASDLQRGQQVLQNTGADYAFTVTSYAFPIQRAIRITAKQRVEMFQPEHFGTRSQDLEEAWHDAGQFYWGQAKAWLEHKPLFSPDAAPVTLPRHRVQDIDTPEDWERAEWMFKALKQSQA